MAATLATFQAILPQLPKQEHHAPGTGSYFVLAIKPADIKQVSLVKPIELKNPKHIPDFDKDILQPLEKQQAEKAEADKAAALAAQQVQAPPALAAPTPVAETPPAGNYAALGQQMAAQRGWTGAQWNALNNLIMRESGWNPGAQNPKSSACGIAQNINGCGAYPDPSPAGQITWALDYIANRYGTPLGAWGHSQATGWY